MTTEPPGDDPDDQRQLRLDEVTTPNGNQCEAIAEYTGDRCRHLSLPGLPYCPDHDHLRDDDLDEPEALKPLKSGD